MTMPAGKYYVGDLCYVMHPQWDEFCEITIKDHDCYDGEFTLKNGVKFATYGTAWGDGVYFDQQGRQYGVDAGLIGCILVSDINDPEAAPEIDGHIIEFEEPFETSYSDGTIFIGHIEINTDDSDEIEEDLEDNY
jgi:hypothetical protein